MHINEEENQIEEENKIEEKHVEEEKKIEEVKLIEEIEYIDEEMDDCSENSITYLNFRLYQSSDVKFFASLDQLQKNMNKVNLSNNNHDK